MGIIIRQNLLELNRFTGEVFYGIKCFQNNEDLYGHFTLLFSSVASSVIIFKRTDFHFATDKCINFD